MRFVVSGEWTRNRLLRVIVWCFLAYTFVLWVSNAGMYFSKMGLTPVSVVTYYCGNEELSMQPRSWRGLLEVLHFHSFAMGILLLTLTHLLLFVPLAYRTKAWGIATAFAAGLGNELSGWAVRFVHPHFAYTKIGFFLLLEAVLLWLMGCVAWALLRRAPGACDQAAERPAG